MVALSFASLLVRDIELVAAYYREVFELTEVEELASPHFRGLRLGDTILGFSGPHAYDLLRIERPSADQVSVHSFLTFETGDTDEVDRLTEFLAMDPPTRHLDAQHDPLPTIGWNGDVVLFSPELLGVHDTTHHDFVAGNVLTEPLSAIVANASQLPYVRDFATGIGRCKQSCEFFAYCQGVHPGNRYFEHGDFTATETEHCRTTFQAPVHALHELTTQGWSP